jgi:hypothetical protein
MDELDESLGVRGLQQKREDAFTREPKRRDTTPESTIITARLQPW